MAQNLKLLLSIHSIAQQGEKILGNRWLPFIDFLRNELRHHGSEAELSSDKILIFTFDQGLAAFTYLLSALLKSKKEHGWKSSSGPCPLQIVVGLAPEEKGTDDMPPDHASWDSLHHEEIYITDPLAEQWQDASKNVGKLPGHKILSDSTGLCRVIFFDHDVGKKAKLLAYRTLPVAGKGPECFYCGMTAHHASLCPSKFLSMSTWGLADVGYLTYPLLNTTYREIFPEKPDIINLLAAGVNPVQVRKNPELLVFISFFDVSAVYQPRFLWNFAFSGYSQWDAIFLSDRIKIDNSNLHLGLDCLRVGQHEQASEILEKENKRKDGDRFAANIGLAFCSLELNRGSDTVRYLNEARNIAHQTRQIIYSNLLLSRYYELQKDFWNAKEALANAMKADYDCLDGQYRRVQLAVREDLSDREFKLLRSLIVGQKEIFMKALLDPQLLPIQGLIEELLSEQHNIIAKDAQKNLDSAQQETTALEVWLPDNDRRRQENLETISQLQQQYGKKSYFDLLDVSERSNGLFFTCRRLRKDNSDRLSLQLQKLGQQLDGYLSFWKGYGYKGFFKKFQTALLKTIKKNHHGLYLLKENSNDSTRRAISLASEVGREFAEIKKGFGRLLWVRTTFDGLKLFGKRLLISEFCIVTLLALLLPLLTSLFAGEPSLAWIATLAANKEVQRNTLVISTLFVAPSLSLAWTMFDLQNK